jgi:hypothetical protein
MSTRAQARHSCAQMPTSCASRPLHVQSTVRDRVVLRSRGFVALVCIVAMLAASMAPVASGSFCAVLVPLPLLFGIVVSAPLPRTEPAHPPSSFVRPTLPARAPPVA